MDEKTLEALLIVEDRATKLWMSLFSKDESIKLPTQVLVYSLNLGHALVECQKARIAATPGAPRPPLGGDGGEGA